uniref:Acetylcholinesterase n=1 Tax=Ditylenchus dipsaci TaxID=166011 RepID=A0A915D6R2_9BILA
MADCGDFSGATMWRAHDVPSVPISGDQDNPPPSPLLDMAQFFQEDCLYLNVHVPDPVDPSAGLPVIFHVYGGSYIFGTAALDLYDCKVLASEQNVIVVSVNYRVNMFGYLYLGRPEVPSNMGVWISSWHCCGYMPILLHSAATPVRLHCWVRTRINSNVSTKLLTPTTNNFCNAFSKFRLTN